MHTVLISRDSSHDASIDQRSNTVATDRNTLIIYTLSNFTFPSKFKNEKFKDRNWRKFDIIRVLFTFPDTHGGRLKLTQITHDDDVIIDDGR